MRRHGLDPLSLVFGLMFTAAGALLMSPILDFGDLNGRWLWPVPLVIVGVVMLVSALTPREDEPAYREPEPAYREPEPAYREPEPAYREPEPVYREPEPDPEPEPSETERDETL